MGGAVSSGQDNDELIDNLKEAEYIKSPAVERVFRVVDRAHYYLVECRENAYKDLAWKNGTLHLSAPCIYSEVMEALELEKGLSFLNLGSGTGYLNTMVGLMIGPYGINHGIELHEDNVNYAREKLESFKQTSVKFDDIELCEPEFVIGNCLNLAPDNRLYDRVYCGASCPTEQKETIQNMIKVNGILVIPVGDQLLKIKRLSETDFHSESVLPVSFASLVQPGPGKENVDPIVLPEVNPLPLQCICRLTVREAIRQTYNFHLPSSELSGVAKARSVKTKIFKHEGGRYPLPVDIFPTSQGLMIMGAFDNSDDNEDENEDDESDYDFLDEQLRRHAIEVRRAHKNLEVSTDEIDSDLSDAEEENTSDRIALLKDINGNKQSCQAHSDSEDQKDQPELMESEDGVAADDEDDEDDEKKDEGSSAYMDAQDDISHSLQRKRKDRRLKSPVWNETSSAGGSSSTENVSGVSFAYSNPYTKLTDRLLSNMSSKTVDSSESHSWSQTTSASCRSISLSSEDDIPLLETSIRSPAIQVTLSNSTTSQPCAIKCSYSTSADTSETSGFGSLGDDMIHVGRQQSISSLSKEEIESATGDRSGLTKDNTAMANEDEGSGDAEWMAMDDEDSDDEEMKNEKDEKSEEEKSEGENGEIRGPLGSDFSAFLKEKVNILPIPSRLKAFILYNR